MRQEDRNGNSLLRDCPQSRIFARTVVQQAQDGQGREALTVVATDNPISDAVLREISALDGVSGVRKAEL